MTSTAATDVLIRVPSNHLMVELLGERHEHLRGVEAGFPLARIVARGNEITISGPERDAEAARTVLEEIISSSALSPFSFICFGIR